MSEEPDETTKLILEEIRLMRAEMDARADRKEAVPPQDVPELSDVERYIREIDEMAEACFKDRRLAVMIDRAIRDAMITVLSE